MGTCAASRRVDDVRADVAAEQTLRYDTICILFRNATVAVTKRRRTLMYAFLHYCSRPRGSTLDVCCGGVRGSAGSALLRRRVRLRGSRERKGGSLAHCDVAVHSVAGRGPRGARASLGGRATRWRCRDLRAAYISFGPAGDGDARVRCWAKGNLGCLLRYDATLGREFKRRGISEEWVCGE